MLKKSSLVLFVMVVLLSIPMQAQEESEQQEEMLERKLEFFKTNLKLNKEEEKNFQELYLHYMKEKKLLRQHFRKEVIQKVRKGNLEKLSKDEKEKMIDAKLAQDKKRCKLDYEFTSKLRKILPAEKVIKYFQLERDFHRKLKKHHREEGRERKRKANQININQKKK